MTDDQNKKQGEGFVMEEGKQESTIAPSQIDFSTFVFSLSTGALINLGLAPDPVTKKVEKNIEVAKQNIDILGILQEKTKGNLTKDEEALFTSLLTEVRLKFIEHSKS